MCCLTHGLLGNAWAPSDLRLSQILRRELSHPQLLAHKRLEYTASNLEGDCHAAWRPEIAA